MIEPGNLIQKMAIIFPFKYKEPKFNPKELYEKLFNDPLVIIVLFFTMVFSFIYFSNEFIFLVISLILPIYQYHDLFMNGKQSLEESQSFIKYLVIFTHCQCFTNIAPIFFNYSFIHWKILFTIFICYVNKYRNKWLTDIYSKMIEMDKFIISLIYSFLIMINKEYRRIKKYKK